LYAGAPIAFFRVHLRVWKKYEQNLAESFWELTGTYNPRTMGGVKMTRYGILALIVLALAMSANAQNSPSNQANASAQAQTNASAAASANSSQPSDQKASTNKQDSKSASASGNTSSSAAASANGNSLNIASGTPIEATLVTPVDAKHSKPGEPVVAKTTQDVKENGQTVLKKGSRLTGHVTQAEARSKANSESSVGMVFDSAVMKNGQKVPMNLSIQALAASANEASADLGNDQGTIDSMSQAGAGVAGARPATGGGGSVRGAGGAAGGVGGTVRGVSNAAGGATSSVGTVGGAAGGVGQTAGGTLGATTRSAGSVGGLNTAGQLASGSSGVFDLQGLNLTSAASNGTTASVVNSTSRNVHLDSGTQMVLQVVSQ
jgi:hypothetical protein